MKGGTRMRVALKSERRRRMLPLRSHGRAVPAGLFLLTILLTGFLMTYPLSGKFLKYLVWRSTADIESQFIPVDGGRLYVEVSGEGEPVLLLTGGLSTIDGFFGQLPELSSGFQVIAVEPRGHGRSGPVTPLTYRLLAADAFSVMDQLGLGRASVVGWSDGGTTGLMMALMNPDRVARLVAVSANFSPAGIEASSREELKVAAPSDPGNWLNRVLYWWRAGPQADWPSLFAVVTAMWRTRPNLDLGVLNGVRAPTLLIVGDRDVVTVEHTRAIAGEIPCSTVHVIKEGIHSSLMWDADEVNARVMGFLRDADAQPCADLGGHRRSETTPGVQEGSAL